MKFRAFVLHVFPPVLLALSATLPLVADSRIAAKYTIGGQSSETVILNQGPRQRLEMGADLVLVRQTDLKRSLQIHEKDKTFEIVSDADSAPKTTLKGGIIEVTTTVVATGETKKIFGQTARHFKTTVERNPQPGACDSKKLKTETDGWYIDLVVPPANEVTPDCVDQVKEKVVGKAVKLGFPVAYTMTTTEEGADPTVLQMEVTALETSKLDAALFDLPAGYRETQKIGGVVAAAGKKVPGMTRIGIAPFGNQAGSSLPPEAFQNQLIGQLSKPGIEAMPLTGATRADAETQARNQQCDYLLAADLTDFKKTTAGKVGGLLNRASSLTNRNGGGNPNENIEAKIEYQLVPLNGGTAINGTVSNKTGGINLKQTVQLAMTVAQFASPFAMLNPRMFQMLQTMRSMQGVGGMGGGGGMGMGMGDPGLGGMMMMFGQSQRNTAPPAVADEGAVVTTAIQRVSKAVLDTVKQ